MKKILVSATVLLSACKQSNEELILGTWSAVSLKQNGVETVNTTIATTDVFHTYTADGILTISNNTGAAPFPYTIDNAYLHIDADDDTIHYAIEELTETSLHITGTHNGTHLDEAYMK